MSHGTLGTVGSGRNSGSQMGDQEERDEAFRLFNRKVPS
jgi:hypothetical protein